MSELRQEMLEDFNNYFKKWQLIGFDDRIDDETPYPLPAFRDAPDVEGKFIVYVQDVWRVNFERVYELKDKFLIEPGFDLDTFGNLVTLVIKLMNDLDPQP
jgi:hypothetical protein